MANTIELTSLVDEFQSIFELTETISVPTKDVDPKEVQFIEPMPKITAYPGYTLALERVANTQGWGKVKFTLSYENNKLSKLGVTVGKSGTEVQSLCEAISVLINQLLKANTDIPSICHGIRGIRGADSEGLGPNRFLGLVDLIGKVLQEAPAIYPGGAQPDIKPDPKPVAVNTQFWPITEAQKTTQLCPECGAELHQMNGCSGGACAVCGYSSCS